ncbi:MAG: ATP-binding protein [Planctomycetota bacterium]
MSSLLSRHAETGIQMQGDQAVPVSMQSGMSPAELTELLSTFNDATKKLEAAHGTLQQHVVRLEGELRETRAQLHRARELAALGEMAAGIAHEVRNPLGSIRLYAELIGDDLAECAEMQGAAGAAKKIVNAVDGLNGIVGDVLAFSREMRVSRVPVDARELLENAANACHAGDEDCSRIVVGGDQLEGVEVCCDRGLMQQALVNVVRNAVEATGKAGGGEVRLSMARRRILDETGRRVPMVALMVSDEGDGISKDALGRIFNPFFTTRETGTGLGLAIVHRIIDAHQGRVQIESSTGDDGDRRGTTVELLIPLTDAFLPEQG